MPSKAILLIFAGCLAFMAAPVRAAVQIQDLTLTDAARGREIPVRVFAPEDGAGPLPLIVFSHGGGESREAFGYFGQGLAERGYIVILLTHRGTDRAEIERARASGPRRLAGVDQFHLRPEDVSFVLDLALAGKTGLALVDGRVDPDSLGLAGQCIGALTVMLFQGLELALPGGASSYRDPRIKAVLALGPAIGQVDPASLAAWRGQPYANLVGPLMVITGGRDFLWVPQVRANERLREAAYRESRGPDRFLLELAGAQHNAFTDSEPYYPAGPRNPSHHGWIVAAAADFLDAYLGRDAAALERLAAHELSGKTHGEVSMEHSEITGPGKAWAVSAQPTKQAAPAPDFGPVDEFLEKNLDRLGGGCALILVQGDRVAHRAAYGDFTTERVAPIASASKWISAGVIMALVDEGAISLDDPAGKYLPEFTGKKAGITIRQMFSHTNGLSPVPRYNWDKSLTLEEAVSGISRVRFVSEPGQGLYYGGAGMQAAGRMAELATGRKWVDLFAEKIAKPLGMTHTDYYAFGRTQNPNVPGSVRTNIDDYGAFVAMLLNHGVYQGKRVLSEAAVREMFRNQTGNQPIIHSAWSAYADFDAAAPRWRYGIGAWLEELGPDGVNAIRASSGGAFGCEPFVDYGQGLAGVFLPYTRDIKQNSAGKSYNEAGVVYLELKKVIAACLEGQARPAAAPAAPLAETASIKVSSELYGLESDTRDVISVESLVLTGPAPGQRLELRLTFPARGGKLPVILLSHLVGGNKDNFPTLARHWAARGYLVIQPNHYDAAESHARRRRMNLSRFPERAMDLSFILDSLGVIQERVPELADRVDEGSVGVSGLLIGAHSASLLAGLRLFQPGGELSFKDERVKAAILLSPQGRGQGCTESSWLEIGAPMLVVAGDENPSRRTGNPPEWRCEPFRFARPGDKYLLYLKGLTGYYGGLTLGGPGDAELARTVTAVSTAFWDAWLKGDATARAFLTAGAAANAWPRVERFEAK